MPEEKKIETNNNPNKVNQYTDPDPRQSLFLKYYLDPKSETFSNALQSGLRAGYSEEYSRNILSMGLDWLSDSIDSEHMVKKAEKNLNNLMESEDEKVKLDTSKFVASRLGKKKWSERIENTGADGKDLIPDKEIDDKISKAINNLLNGKGGNNTGNN
jgi:hypothetical protein